MAITQHLTMFAGRPVKHYDPDEKKSRKPYVYRLGGLECGEQKLDQHHHFISAPFVKQLKALPIKVDVGDAKEPEFYTYNNVTDVNRYIVVSE